MRQTIIIVRFAVDVARLQNQVRFARLLTKVHQAFNVVEWLCRIWWVGHQNVILWRCFGSDTGIEVFAFVIHVWEAASSKLIFHTVLRIEGGLYPGTSESCKMGSFYLLWFGACLGAQQRSISVDTGKSALFVV